MSFDFTSGTSTPSSSSGGGFDLSSLLGIFGGNQLPPGFSSFNQFLQASFPQAYANSGTTPPFTSSGSGTDTTGSSNGGLGGILATLGLSLPGLGVPGNAKGTSPFPTSSTPGSGNGSGTDLTKLLPILGLLGLTGALNNRPTTQTSTPNLPANLQPLQQATIDNYMKGLTGTDLTGYTSSGVDDLNNQANIQKQNALETAAARGVSGPAVDTSLNSIDAQRSSAVSKFRQSIPLLENSILQGNTNNAANFINSSKTGLTTTSSGNILGGAASGPASLLAYLYGTGQL